MSLQVANATVSVAADAVAPLLNTGYIRIYSGTQPATADTALSGNTLLAELRFAATAFPASVNGVATANAISAVVAAASGTATFARLLKSDGTTVVLDCGVGTSGADINLNTTSIVINAQVSITSFQIQESKT